jgi:hypothetical protein
MALVRFAIGFASVVVLGVIWRPALMHGLWPYSERFTESEKRETEAAELRALILTAYWIAVIINLALMSPIYNIRTLLLANAITLPLVACWHLVLRSHANKKRELRRVG